MRALDDSETESEYTHDMEADDDDDTSLDADDDVDDDSACPLTVQSENKAVVSEFKSGIIDSSSINDHAAVNASVSSNRSFPDFASDNPSIAAHANDDEFLISSELENIDLSDTCWTNRDMIAAKKATLPIQLYRLLRLSALRPDLDLNKAISWTEDGNGFQLHDEEHYLIEVLAKTSKIRKTVSFRNTLGQFNFRRIGLGKNASGKHYKIYQHRSIAEAKEAKDPSLRQFYRGVPLETMWGINSRKDESGRKAKSTVKVKVNETKKDKKPSDSTRSSRLGKRTRDREGDDDTVKVNANANANLVWNDEEYGTANGASTNHKSDKRTSSNLSTSVSSRRSCVRKVENNDGDNNNINNHDTRATGKRLKRPT